MPKVHNNPINAIEIHDADKQFHIYKSQKPSLRGLFIKSFNRFQKVTQSPIFSLQDLTISIPSGENMAIVGVNGSGKSTLLRLMAGVYSPTRGRIVTRGRLAALIELGAGFHPDLTGAENIYLYGNILGMTNHEINRFYDSIIDFSGVAKFINTSLKYYSSGMKMRLGFSVATAMMPDIFLIDEILAVGDADFQGRCLERMNEFQKKGCTIVIATHDLDMACSMTSKAIWMDDGKIRSKGQTDLVVKKYMDSFE